jgi:sterol desaturase/sphingolipid hydroxylase (fatty acid hydroxylase superfamily)
MMGAMFANSSVASDLPPLPEYSLQPMPPLLSFISDFWLSILAPHIAYWLVSMLFHAVDVFDLFPQYRLHTPEEITERNHATRWEVARDVILEQVIQVFTAALLSLSEPVQTIGKEEYDVAVWATRIRLAQRSLPALLGLLGLNAASISKNMAASHPMIAGALAGGHYPFLTTSLDGVAGAEVPAFALWELYVAKLLYWVVIPVAQIYIGIAFLDAWQYFWHRAMHVNKWMYSKFWATSRGVIPHLEGRVWALTESTSALARPPPPSLRSIRVRGAIQPSDRGLRHGYVWRRACVQGVDDDATDGHVVLRGLHGQDGRRPLRLRSPVGPAAAPHEQQRGVSRHTPPELGDQDQLLPAFLHLLGPDTGYHVEGRHYPPVRARQGQGCQEGVSQGSVSSIQWNPNLWVGKGGNIRCHSRPSLVDTIFEIAGVVGGCGASLGCSQREHGSLAMRSSSWQKALGRRFTGLEFMGNWCSEQGTNLYKSPSNQLQTYFLRRGTRSR